MKTGQMLNKIMTPLLPVPILRRESLVRTLIEAIEPPSMNQIAAHKLILLCAPAGYGKTTLLVNAIQQLSIPCCWYFLEPSDAQPHTFLKTLLASIQLAFPSFGTSISALLEKHENTDGQENWYGILDALIEALHKELSGPYVLALCNYHQVNQHETINNLINRLLAHLPQQAILIIESRALPNLNLASLIANRQFFGLGHNRLCFTAEELHKLAYLQGFTTFSLEEAELLVSTFEGWIAGILLGSSLGYTQLNPLLPSPERNWETPALLADRQQLSIYITNEVFHQETSSYEFLKAISIFDRFTPEQCNELLEINDATRRLIYAEQQGLFIVRSKEPVTKTTAVTYLCHPIVRAVLREDLQHQSIEQYRSLHRRAAQILQRDQQYEQAFMHAIQAQEYTPAIDIMTSIAKSLLDRGDDETVAHWLTMLPEHKIKQDPRLLLVQINIHLTRNEYAQVPALLDDMEAMLDALSAGQERFTYMLLQVELKLARSKLSFYQREFQAAQEFCLQALKLLPIDERPLRIRAYQRLGVCFIVGNGRIQEGIVQFQQALQLSNAQKDERQQATLHRLLANAYGWIGNYTLADYHQTRALQIWEKLDESWSIINSLTGIGLLKLRQGVTQEAEEALTKALTLARETYHFKSGEAYALVALGELHCTQARYIPALTYLEQGLSLAYECQDRYLIHCGLCSLVTTYLFMDEVQTGKFFLDQIVLNEQEEQSYEGLLYYLTQNMFLLAQQAYNEAQQGLERAVAVGRRTNIQFLHIQALLTLAICYARQTKLREARQAIEQANELNKKGDFDYAFIIVSRRYPELKSLLGQSPREDTLPLSASPSAKVQSPPAINGQLTINSPEVAQRLRILAFGEPTVQLDDIPITRWHTARSLELFFLLLEKAGPVQKEIVIDALWPNTTSDQIDTTMRTAIYYLRQAIGKKCIVYRSGCYSLNLPAVFGKQIWHDVALFEMYSNQAKQSLAEGDDVAANKAFTAMVDLYKGDYLQSFYNDWCIPRRDQLRAMYMDAREQLALIAWHNESWEESLQHWQHLLAIDACFEKAHYGIMRCYLRLGKREFALRQYQCCCQNLQEELHTIPNSSIQKLYQRMIQANASEEVAVRHRNLTPE